VQVEPAGWQCGAGCRGTRLNVAQPWSAGQVKFDLARRMIQGGIKMASVTKAAEALNRRDAVESVLASFRIEGLEPDAETLTLLDRFSGGGLSIEEFGAAIDRHAARLRSERVAQAS
jgi:hypothetical protein